MSHCVISAKYPPQIDVTRTPLAYGSGALPRLNRELNDSTDIVKQRAVRSLCDYLHDPEHIVSAIKEGIPASLKKLLSDKDTFCRFKSAECLFVMSSHAIGRQAIISGDIIGALANLFDDKEPIARKNGHQTIEMLCEIPAGAGAIIELKLIKMLVEKLKTEIDEIKEIILDTLHFCMMVETQQALDAKAMGVFTDLLNNKSKSIKAKTARDIFDLCIPLQGKNEAIEIKTVNSLVLLLKDDDINVKCKSALALETIAITTPGKYSCINAGAIDLTVPLINSSFSEVKLNALKLMTCLSEAPEGRKELLKHIEKIKQLENDPMPIVSKHANIAVRTITWKP